MISFLSKRRGATLAGMFGMALASLVLLCGAGSAPIENLLPQGAMQGDLNAGGHNVTNAATVYATNIVVSGSLTAPLSFTLPFAKLTSTPTTLSGYGITDPVALTSGSYANPAWITSLAYSKLSGAPSLATVATTGSYSDLSGKPTLPPAIALTTTGSSGAATYNSGTGALNIPQYSGGSTYTFSAPLTNNAGTVSIPGGTYDASGAAATAQAYAIQRANHTGTQNATTVLASKSAFLTAGFNGGFLSGRERAYLLYSGDGVNWSNLYGLDKYSPPPFVNTTTGNAASTNTISSLASLTGINTNTVITSGPGITTTPPTFVTGVSGSTITLNQNTTTTTNGASFTFSQPTGLRDVDITKLGTKYFAASTISFNGGTQGYFDVASSPDLVTWTHVANVAASGPSTSPKWFYDPVGGGTWVVGYGFRKQNTSTTGGYPDGVTWGSDIAMTVSGITRGYGDEFLLYAGGTYIYLCSASGSPQTYHICTSSTLGGTYADQGAPANWPTGVEGIRAFYDSATGLYYAYFSNGQFSTSSTPAVPSSWSAVSSVNSTAPGGNLLSFIDNGGGICANDADTLRDVLNAFSQSYWFNPSLPDAPLQYSNRYPLNFGVALTPQNGIGTIGSVTNWQLTGAGTAFTKQLQPGTIINDNHGHSGVVGWVVSDTVVNLNSEIGNVSLTAGDAFTFTPPALTYVGNGTSDCNFVLAPGSLAPGTGYGGKAVFGSGMLHWFYPLSNGTFSGVGWNVGFDGSGDWQLAAPNYGGTMLVVNKSARASSLNLGSSVVSILGGTSSTLVSAGNVGYLAAGSVASGSAVSLTTATAANVCNTGALAAGHYTVTFTCTLAASGATVSSAVADINTTSATLPASSGREAYVDGGATSLTGNNTVTVVKDVTFTSTTTIYGIAQASFSAGTMSAFGSIQAHQIP